MSSQATSVTAWGRHRSPIAARLLYLREIDRMTFWEFCNSIGTKQTFRETPRARRFPHPACCATRRSIAVHIRCPAVTAWRAAAFSLIFLSYSFSPPWPSISTTRSIRDHHVRRQAAPPLTILPPVTALAIGLPAQRAIAQRFSGVLGMFSSLEVKVLYPT